MTSLNTGDLLFCSSKSPLSKIIRFFSDPIGVISGKFVPSHVAMIRRVDGGVYVYESTTSKGGVSRTPLDRWLNDRKNEKILAVKLDLTSWRRRLGEVLEGLEGIPYENWLDMPSIILDKNRKDNSRLFCSEMCLLAYRRAGLNFLAPKHNPHNTEPDELWDWFSEYGRVTPVE